MSKEEIFNLWKKVLSGDTTSKIEFIKLYLQRYPRNQFLVDDPSKENLHIMYLHLYR